MLGFGSQRLTPDIRIYYINVNFALFKGVRTAALLKIIRSRTSTSHPAEIKIETIPFSQAIGGFKKKYLCTYVCLPVAPPLSVTAVSMERKAAAAELDRPAAEMPPNFALLH